MNFSHWVFTILVKREALMCTTCSRDFHEEMPATQNFASDPKEVCHYMQVTFTPIAKLYVISIMLPIRVRKYAKIVQMTPQRLRRDSLRLQKFSVTNWEPLRLQKFSVTNTVLSLRFSQQIQFTLIITVVNHQN